MSTMPFGDFLSGFSNLLGGTASLPYLKSTSENLPFQDALFNAFQNRQSVFAPTIAASGSPDARGSNPFYNLLSGGGLEWSYDPNWKTGLPRPAAPVQSFFAAPPPVTTGGGGGHRQDVHGGPAQEVIELKPNELNLTAPPKPPDQPGGHWVWDPRGGGTGDPGVWVFVPSYNAPHERVQY